jgi:hypothetical protein
MSARDAVKLLLAEHLQPLLKERGFRKKGLTFYRQVGGNFALINFQKSTSSTQDFVKFTINLGVFSQRLHAARGDAPQSADETAIPNEIDCHLRTRIGALLPERNDAWWSLFRVGDGPELGAQLVDILKKVALPFLDARTSDEGLRDHWLASPHPYANGALKLPLLLKEVGPQDAFDQYMAGLRASAETSYSDRQQLTAVESLLKIRQEPSA